MSFQKFPKFSWKSAYMEKYISEIIEQLQPQYNDEDNIDEILTLVNPYVKTLIVTQLQAWKPPLTATPEDLPEIFPNDHIDFSPIFKKLEYIVELDLVFSMHKLGENFNWEMLKVSVDDCKRLGIAILQLKFITKLRIHRSKIGDLHVQALLQQLVKNTTILGKMK